MAKEIKNYDIIKRPVITEKSTFLSANNQVVFMVDSVASKPEIKSAIENVFSVKVKSVNVINGKSKVKYFRGRKGARSAFKKAVITLEAGQTIDITAKIG